MLQTTENTVLMVHLVIQLSNREGLATVLTLKYQVMREIRSKSLKVISKLLPSRPAMKALKIKVLNRSDYSRCNNNTPVFDLVSTSRKPKYMF